MNRKILLTLIFVLVAALSIGSIYASDVNSTGSHVSSVDDSDAKISVESQDLQASEAVVDNDSSVDVLKSENSSTLSTNTQEVNLLASDNNATSYLDASKTINAKGTTKYYKGSTKYTATFLDLNGTALNNTKVKIVVNGKTYTKTTDSKGVVSLDINLKPGTYKVTATNPVTGYSLTTNFKILSTISAKNINKVYTDTRKFTATFYKSNGKVLANKYIKFKINGKTYKVKTNSKGVASLSVKNLKKGTHKIISYNRDGLTRTNTIKVVTSAKTSLTANDYTFLSKDTKKIKVRLLNEFGYAPLKGKVIKFTVNGKTYRANTNKYGYATLKLPSLKNGVYTVKYSFAKYGYYKASSTKAKLTIIPSKTPTYTVKSTTIFGHGAKTPFKVAVTSGSVPLAGKKITINVDGKTYSRTTNSQGLAAITINLDIGTYKITYTNDAESKISKKTESTTIQVVERNASSINWKSSTTFNQGTQTVKLLILDSNGKAVSGGAVKLNVNGKEYSATTDSNGYATISASFTPGNYSVSYSFEGDNLNAPSTGQSDLHVEKLSTVSLANVITAAKSLKNYIANNNNLPTTVSCGGLTFTVPEFLYIMCQAINELGNAKTSAIAFITGVEDPTSPSGDAISTTELYKSGYLALAKNVANYISTHKQAPNYASSAVGNIIYNELVDATARILAWYGDNGKVLPNYVTISYGDGGGVSPTGTGINEKNTIKDLTPYLKSTTNCPVNNDAIKKVVDGVTKGLTSASAKAKAIFNYVRDYISYSFYYDTKYGAVNTLKYKTGNCVDQSHLLVAMFRTADLPARYVHGTCRFSSGSTYGHVWTQVLIDGKWTVADATSSRNSLGSVANWNTKSFTLHRIYSSLSF